MLEDKNTKGTTIEDYGKEKFLNDILKKFKTQSNRKHQIDLGEHKNSLSNQLFMEGIHFNLAYFPIQHLGYKIIVASISNILSNFTRPTHLSINIATSNRFTVEAIDMLTQGMAIAMDEYEINLVQLEFETSVKGLIVSTAAFGQQSIDLESPKETDVLVLSGDLGAAYFGLQVLERENEVFKVDPQNQPDLTSYDYIIGRQLKPTARLDVLDILKDLEITPGAFTLVNKGLTNAALEISKQSNLACQLFEEKIPVDQQSFQVAEELKMNVTTVALSGGEDYEVLFSVPIEKAKALKDHPHFSIIGYLRDSSVGNNLIGNGGSQIPLKNF